jgi:hypothetical protein
MQGGLWFRADVASSAFMQAPARSNENTSMQRLPDALVGYSSREELIK